MPPIRNLCFFKTLINQILFKKMSDSSQKPRNSAVIITIGDELLSGRIEDQNTGFLIKQLNLQGISIECCLIIPDDVEIIANVISVYAPKTTWLFLSGGLGPTHDDVTLEGVAKAFDTVLERKSEISEFIESRYGDRCTEDHLKMADIPKGAELIKVTTHNFPILRFKNLIIFPGIPKLLQHLFNSIRDMFQGERTWEQELLLETDEGIIANELAMQENKFRGLKIGSYPVVINNQPLVKIVLKHKSREMLVEITNALTKIFADYLVGTPED